MDRYTRWICNLHARIVFSLQYDNFQFYRCGGNAICTAETAVVENVEIGSVREFER